MYSQRPRQQPGCGGCLLILLLVTFLFGGAQGVFSLLGTLASMLLTAIVLLVALFWGFSLWARSRIATYERSQTESHNRFVWLLVQILIHTAKIDGRITRDEVHTIHRFFQYNLRYSQTQMLWVKELIREATGADHSLDDLLREFKTTFAYEPRLILLELVYQVLYTNSAVPEQELQLARYIATFLDISTYDQRTIEAKYRYRGTGSVNGGFDLTEKHYATLGLEPGADMEAIKKAYRKLSMQYHPDKVAHLGAEFGKVAEEKMKDINAAYDFFKKSAK